jgi:hypothetical protein
MAIFSITAINQVNAIYEDQSYLCKSDSGKISCIIIDDDDVITDNDILEGIWNQFNYDLDTFSSQYLTEID